MHLDSVPLWAIFMGTMAVVMLAIGAGFLVGRRNRSPGEGKGDSAGVLVASAMGLLAFMLGFTFNSAAVRYDARKNLVVQEVNAIGTTWLRAGLLPEPYRSDIRGLLKEYVDLRSDAVPAQWKELEQAMRRSDALQDQLWARAAEIGRSETGSIAVGLFVQSLNEMIDLHLERVKVGVRDRIPAAIWVALYVLAMLAMGMAGVQLGMSGKNFALIELALALSFSVKITSRLFPI